MDNALTQRLKTWLETPADRRDIEQGRTLILQLMRNPFFANGFAARPKAFMKQAEYELGKFLRERTAGAEHTEVERMAVQVAAINKADGLDQPLPGSDKAKKSTASRIARTEKFVKGRRADHDQLPEEIQALYTENLSIVQQKRALHAQLLVITRNAESKDYCPDGDRYPLVKEIIALDEKEKANWEKYDTWNADVPVRTPSK